MNLRAAPGELSGPGSEGSAFWIARTIFLSKLELLVPSALLQLVNEVLPHYVLPERAGVKPQVTPHQLVTGSVPPDFYDWRRQSDPFKASLLEWAKKWHLEEEWMFTAAVGTLAAARLGTRGDAWVYPPHGLSLALTDDERRFEFSTPGWQPQLVTREGFEANVRLVFDSILDSYLDHIERLAFDRGLRRVAEKRPRKGCGVLRAAYVGDGAVAEASIGTCGGMASYPGGR